MKRPLTLTAFIIGTAILGVDLILECIGLPVLFALLAELASAPELTFYVIIALMTVALVVVSLVFNAISISAWNKPAEAFAKKRKMIITAVVLNFVLVLVLLISTILGSISVMTILLMIALVATNVLALIDLAKEKKIAA